MKACSSCKVVKPLSDFCKDASRADKLESVCRICKNAYSAKYRTKNKERLAEARATNAERRAAATAKWRAANRDRALAYKAAYNRANLEKDAARSGRRRARTLCATPVWANEFFISEAYALAKLRTQVSGYRWHVDHIVPLQGRKVCGLHVEHNLQVIPGIVNMRKNNKHSI